MEVFRGSESRFSDDLFTKTQVGQRGYCPELSVVRVDVSVCKQAETGGGKCQVSGVKENISKNKNNSV